MVMFQMLSGYYTSVTQANFHWAINLRFVHLIVHKIYLKTRNDPNRNGNQTRWTDLKVHIKKKKGQEPEKILKNKRISPDRNTV